MKLTMQSCISHLPAAEPLPPGTETSPDNGQLRQERKGVQLSVVARHTPKTAEGGLYDCIVTVPDAVFEPVRWTEPRPFEAP